MRFDHIPLPGTYSARAGREEDRAFYAEATVLTLGGYARELYGLDDDAVHSGSHEEYEPGNTTVITDATGVPVGVYVVEDHGHELWIDHMVILPEHQGRGLGTVLVRGTGDVARERAVPMTLSVVDGNPARELYERLGFVVARVEPPRTFLVLDPPS